MRKNVRFLSFWLLLTMGMATVVFNSYGQKNNSKKEVTDPTYYDEGVIINGVKWATRNVDKPGTFAATPESTGMFYQWNRRVGWSATDPMINSDGGTDWNGTDSESSIWKKSNDPCPAGWRMPTQQELQKLVNAGSQWTTVNGVEGTLLGNGLNTIFLPAFGFRSRSDGMLGQAGSVGYYWSSTQYNSNVASFLDFYKGITPRVSGYNKANGILCRCVAE